MILTLIITLLLNQCHSLRHPRALQIEHEKPQAVKWMEAFFDTNYSFDQVRSFVNLINTITTDYLTECTPIVLYDVFVEQSEELLLEQMFRKYPIPYVHGQISSGNKITNEHLHTASKLSCVSYIMFVADVMKCLHVIGEQPFNKVVIVARSSQWRVYEFLASEVSKVFVNLLVITQTEKITGSGEEKAFILYTHRMYTDALGSSAPVVLTSWKGNGFSRRVNLFPRKMVEGFSGHRFIVSLAHQPPYVVRRSRDTNNDYSWDGVEIRLVNMLSKYYNFTTDYRESRDLDLYGSGDAVCKEVSHRKSNLGIGGIYITPERFATVDVSQAHSQDCATFITLGSNALPKYRAIMGPFHWTVWVALTCVYLFAIFPLALSDKLTLMHLLKKPEEIENMFWYVFGTFTNCFTFRSADSWSKSEKVTTRLLIGFYWVFTIITTACYTGSIIAFVTLPVYPETVDTVKQLVEGRFQLGTLDRGGWQYWFFNSTDKYTNKLLTAIEFLPNIQAGIKNVTGAFFWPYAFLGSASELDYVLRTNYTTTNKRATLHISDNCFVPYGIAVVFPSNSVYKEILNQGLLQAVQTGFIIKFNNDIRWEMMRSATGQHLQASAGDGLKLRIEDRALTLDDTQGMFLLLAIGFVMGGVCLLSEWLGGCFNFCKRKVRRLSNASIESNPRTYSVPTPREKLNSLEYSINTRFSIAECEDETILPNGAVVHEVEVEVIGNWTADGNQSNESSTDYDEEIDRIFNLEALFGESAKDDEEIHFEELNECSKSAEIGLVRS